MKDIEVRNSEAEAKQFEEKHGVNLLDLTKAAEAARGCDVLSTLKGLPEDVHAQAFNLMGAINKKDREKDPKVLEIEPFQVSIDPRQSTMLKLANAYASLTGADKSFTYAPSTEMGLLRPYQNGLVRESWDLDTKNLTATHCENETETK